MMVYGKYNALNVHHFGRASIRTNPLGDQKTVDITFGETIFCSSLTGEAPLR
jgi:hypothetical protein